MNTMLRRKLNLTSLEGEELGESDRSNKIIKLDSNNAQNTGLNLTIHDCNQKDISKYFPNSKVPEDLFTTELLELQLGLNGALRSLYESLLLQDTSISYVYYPLEYALKPYELFVKTYCTGPKKILFVGINPGPFGMCQTGVPFGDVKCVRDFLKIEADVSKPDPECPNRLISGFACTKSEISGSRFWKKFKEICLEPENFFKNAVLFNYCPVAYMKSDGKNITPSDMKPEAKTLLQEVCDKFYLKLIRLLQPEVIIAIGDYAEKRTTKVLKSFTEAKIKVIRMPHPSPRAVNNTEQEWREKTEKFLINNDLIRYFKS